MKGTLYTADFINTIDGVKLLELNTDTAFTDSIIDGFDFQPLHTVLTDNSLSNIHVIYKPTIQQNFVDKLTEYLNVSASTITLLTTEESEHTIYPTDVVDSDDTFVLRLAYNESAIFDSEYCKDNINLYELLKPADGEAGHTVNYYYSSSEQSIHTDLLLKRVEYAESVPDFVVRYSGVSNPATDRPGFYKLGHSSASIEDRVSDFIQEFSEDGILITNYFDTSEDTNYMKSIRVCNVLYGTNLDNITLYAKKVDAILDKPKTVEDFVHDDTQLYTKFHLRHLYELATNSIKFDYNTQEGVGTDVELVSSSLEVLPIDLANVGDIYQSIHIPGLPDTDDISILLSWSLDGGELPSNSFVTSSQLISKQKNEVEFGVLREIVIDSGSFLAGPNLPLLVYDSVEDKIRYKPIHDVNPSVDKLFNGSGSKVDLLENNFFVLPEIGHTIMLNFETNDTFLINETNVRIVSHNIVYGSPTPPAGFYGACFVAGTKVTMSDGSTKNIEDVVIGDTVLSFNEKTRETESKSVINLMSPTHNDIVSYEFGNGSTLQCTTDHPLYVNNFGLASYNPDKTIDLNRNGVYNIEAEIFKISTNDVVRDSEKNKITINSITENIVEDTQTYIISVEDNHNFYANGILVHNKI